MAINQSFFCLLSCSKIRKIEYEGVMFWVWKKHVYRKQKLPTFYETKGKKIKVCGWLWVHLREKHIKSENFRVDHNKASSARGWSCFLTPLLFHKVRRRNWRNVSTMFVVWQVWSSRCTQPHVFLWRGTLPAKCTTVCQVLHS